MLVRKEPDQEDEHVFSEVTVIIRDVFHFWKTEVVKRKIRQDNIICKKLYLQGSVRLSPRKVSILKVGFKEKFLVFSFHSFNLC